MDAGALKALFEPFGAVSVRRMFGGTGIYADGLCFAIESGGDVYLKSDAQSRPAFAAADSAPFTFMAKGRPMTTSYWRLIPSAYDDPTELERWARLGWEAARRAAAAKPKGRAKTRKAG